MLLLWLSTKELLGVIAEEHGQNELNVYHIKW